MYSKKKEKKTWHADQPHHFIIPLLAQCPPHEPDQCRSSTLATHQYWLRVVVAHNKHSAQFTTPIHSHHSRCQKQKQKVRQVRCKLTFVLDELMQEARLSRVRVSNHQELEEEVWAREREIERYKLSASDSSRCRVCLTHTHTRTLNVRHMATNQPTHTAESTRSRD
jgi:hypothetical protein